ncbi:hypothetical protein [Thauera aromatica]|uniref:hypothetical protein n=1 Tax=Thauera aromatica TaxID=59405 RepID=UPI001FFD0D11|nr:hypothetical protein [Thauera aromatica]MCK2097656.1 hypothetical protein [Thauera aromatica]
MCNFWQLWALSPCWLAQQVVSGWVMGWHQGQQRNASWLWQRPTQRAGNALLKTQISALRLNANAPFPLQKREAAQRHLRAV